jgi:hypothetical protein
MRCDFLHYFVPFFAIWIIFYTLPFISYGVHSPTCLPLLTYPGCIFELIPKSILTVNLSIALESWKEKFSITLGFTMRNQYLFEEEPEKRPLANRKVCHTRLCSIFRDPIGVPHATFFPRPASMDGPRVPRLSEPGPMW